MSYKHYTITQTAPIAELLAALQDKYGSANVTVHYQSATALVFSCAALSPKVIKVVQNNLCFYYGDAWTSGTTITNSVQFSMYDTTAVTPTQTELVLGDNTLFLCQLCPSIVSKVVMIGKLTNDDFIAIGMVGTNNSSFYTNSTGKNVTDGVNIWPVTLSHNFVSGTGSLFKQPLIFKHTDGTVELNSDGSLATIPGVFNVSYGGTASALVLGSNFLISPIMQYMSDAGLYLRGTALMAEF